ncbi:MAG: hypothetical protein ACMVY4_21945 [Minwuia sp.]|uniref:hypothetical protein n=1 Tax=Minwuia sp. TaxID=2493630 RepID=UPI003A850D0D
MASILDWVTRGLEDQMGRGVREIAAPPFNTSLTCGERRGGPYFRPDAIAV